MISTVSKSPFLSAEALLVLFVLIGTYNITPELKITYRIGKNNSLIKHFLILKHNLTEKFITTIVKPNVSEFELPLAITLTGSLTMSTISMIDYRRFGKLFK